MKKILFDLSATQSSPDAKFHGGSEYAKTIFFNILDKSSQIVCFFDSKYELSEDVKIACDVHNIETCEVSSTTEIEALLARGDVESLYSAMPYRFHSLNFLGKRFVATIHGLRDLECPKDIYEYKYSVGLRARIKCLIKLALFSARYRQLKYKKSLQRLLLSRNIDIITDSQHSKYSMLSFFPEMKPNSITVKHAPMEIECKAEVSIGTEQVDEYFLLVSANRWVKNNYRAIEALDQLFSEGRLLGKRVICLGSSKGALFNNVVNIDRFQFVGYVEPEKLQRYFVDAFCFVYPSLNEGYGYPPLQAMRSNVPVLASACTSIVEVCENAALYFNPFSVDEMKARLLNITDSEILRNQLVLSGKRRYAELAKNDKKNLEEIKNLIFGVR